MNRDETLEQIIAMEFSDVSLSSYEDVSGLNKVTYLVSLDDGTELVVTWIEDMDKESDFKIEADILEYVNIETDLSVPGVRAENFEHSELPPYYIIEKIEGYNPDDRFKYMPEDTKKKLLKRAGKILGRLHNQTSFDTHGNFRHTEKGLELEKSEKWSQTLEDSIGHHMKGLEEKFFQKEIERVRETFENYRHLIDREFEPVLVHEDFRPGNLIIKEDKINAVIDWERALSGDREYDLFKAERDFIDLKFNSKETQENYRGYLLEGYRKVSQISSGWEDRRKFYRFINVVQDLKVFSDHYQEWTETKEEQKRIAKIFRQKLNQSIEELEESQ